MRPPQIITKKEMELLIALQGGKHTNDLKSVHDLDTRKKKNMDRSNLHGYLKSLELRGFIKREIQGIERRNTQKGGPIRGPKWFINWDMWLVIRQELERLRGDKTRMESEARIGAFWDEVEKANQETEWERQFMARQEHYRTIKEVNSKKE